MNKMAEISSSTASWTVIILTRHCSIITGFYQLIWIGWRIQSLLNHFLLVSLLEFGNSVVGELDKLVVVYVMVFVEHGHDV